MSDSYTYPTQSANDLLKNIAEAGAGIFVNPDTAVAGDIIGAHVSTKSTSERNGYALAYHIDRFITKEEDGSFEYTNFINMPEDRKPAAALLAMHLNLLTLAHSSEVIEALALIDDQDGDIYADMVLLPSIILIYRNQYEDIMEVFDDDPQETQDQINAHFIALCENNASNHREIQVHKDRARDLGILAQLEPIRVDYEDAGSPAFAMSLDLA